jgi:hypothetical protein
MAEFFDKTPVEPVVEPTEPTAPEKIKLGEEEYTQEQLSELVGLGKIGKEFSEKWDRPIEKMWPAFNEEHKELLDLRERVKQPVAPVAPTPDVSQEDIKAQALAQAKELGLVTVDNINDYIESRIGAHRLLDDVEYLKETANVDGKPVPDEDALLNYMAREGIRNPNTAYELLYKKELGDWEKQQVETIKQPGFTTQEPQGGPKTPPETTPTTRDNLSERIRASLNAPTEAQ